MTNIVLPYTGQLNAQVLAAVQDYDDLLLVECQGVDSYHELLRRCWSTGMDFLVVEHDVVVSEQAIQELIDCPQPWCAQPYLVAGKVQTALGCTRFRGEFTAHWEDVWSVIADQVGTHWSVLDAALTTLLGNVGVTCHDHSTQVEHLNARASHRLTKARRRQIESALRQARETKQCSPP